MTPQWISMHYPSGRRTVIGVLNEQGGELMAVHKTIDTQYHNPTDAPGGVDVGFIRWMKDYDVGLYIHETARLGIETAILYREAPIRTTILTGPFSGEEVDRVFIPRQRWFPSTVQWIRPARYSDEIALDESGRVLSMGIDTRKRKK